MKTITQLCTQLRKRYLIREIAEAAGVSPMTIQRWLLASPDKVNMEAYAKLAKMVEELKPKKKAAK